MWNRVSGTAEIASEFSNAAAKAFDAGASRRKFLKILAAAGAGAALPGSRLLAQAISPSVRVLPGRIDVHHHMFPPFYVKAMEAELRANGFTLRSWNPATSIDMMDKHGIATAMVSPVQRLVMDSMSDRSEKGRSLARQNNEYGAQLVKDYPGRFGHFAALPLPDADGSLKETVYALDTLKADGIALWTSFMDKWLGDPSFDPVYEELNRRSAVVFVHPARASCCRNLPGQSGIIEYDIDTARAIDSLLWNGTTSKFPNIRFIFSHSGGAFPVLAARIVDDYPKNRADKVPNGVDHEIKKLYFDTAHAGWAPALDSLKDIVPVSQILYGSDAPIRNYELTDNGLVEYAGFSENDWKQINRGNAERLFPRLKA
ncbi:MAG TPA: amidohydrolase family protein [Candidatus Acidoferrales bacterium]|nr:amidohydrolase family protein [Candidatus Acidoferrales bacterium]